MFPLLAALTHAATAAESARKETRYPETAYFGVAVDTKADWYRQCMQVKDVMPPKGDMPARELSASFTSCIPSDMYYDTLSEAHSADRDWSLVRTCAFSQDNRAVLMMLYANGYGVKQNLALALRYACSMPATPAELSGRVHHLMWLKKSPGKGAAPASRKPFDQCDDASSTLMTGVCAEIVERQDARSRQQQLAEISTRLSPEQRAALEQLWQATQDFAEARGINETEHAGGGRKTTRIAAESAEKNLLLEDLAHAEKGELPGYTQEHYSALDAQLNATYQRIMRAEAKSPPASPGVTKGDVRETQRAWLKYRDAWIAYGHARHPAIAAQAWGAWLTERRIGQMETLLGEFPPDETR